jgi:hypothetical protein
MGNENKAATIEELHHILKFIKSVQQDIEQYKEDKEAVENVNKLIDENIENMENIIKDSLAQQ